MSDQVIAMVSIRDLTSRIINEQKKLLRNRKNYRETEKYCPFLK